MQSLSAGQKPHIDYNLIPNVIYTWPEVASVGKTEEQLKSEGKSYKSGQFPMRALGRARASMDTDGFVKILADSATDEVLGVHMIGARAADLIAEAVTAMEFRASAEDIARMSHSHPTENKRSMRRLDDKRCCSYCLSRPLQLQKIVLFIYNFNYTEHVEVIEF